MPRNISSIYSIPSGTEGFPDTTIESAKYNTYIHDVETDLNTPRPIVAGGTGANDADEARANLAAEKSTQPVTNYDSHIWYAGSFYSAAGATGAPNGHAFAGIAYSSDPISEPPANLNVTVEARDLNDTTVPGRLYVREKKANVWGAWTVVDASTLPFPPGGGISATTILAAIQELEAEKAPIDSPVFTGDARAPTPPPSDNDTSIATTAFVNAAIFGSGAPSDALAYNGMQINGNFDINQMGVSSITTTGYLCDGWKLNRTGSMAITASIGTSHSFEILGFDNGLFISVQTAQPSLAAGDVVYIGQPIEGYRTVKLNLGTTGTHQSMTLGFWSMHSLTGLYSGSVSSRDADPCSYVFTYTQAAAGIPQYNTIVIPGGSGGLGGIFETANQAGLNLFFAMASGTTFTAPSANTWLAGRYYAAPGQVNAVATTGVNFGITGVVLIPGVQIVTAARSALLTRSYDQELQICRRYFQRIGGAATNDMVLQAYAAAAGAIHSITLPISPVMRTIPTISQSGAWFLLNATANLTNRGASSFVWQITSTNIGQMHHYNISVNGSFLLDARL